jgi:hypothetical protein
MATYLLTWNPKRYAWDSFSEDLQTLRETGSLEMNWSCGNTKRILDGDRLFMIRQGSDNPGLIASGVALSPPYTDTHWEDERPTVARKALYIEVRLDSLSETPIISREKLRTGDHRRQESR